MNIILVTGAKARARTITLDWRHGTAGSVALCSLFIAFALAFNFATLKWAAAARHRWLQVRVARLDGLGERLATTAGLEPQDLPGGLSAGTVPGRGGAPSSLPPVLDIAGEQSQYGKMVEIDHGNGLVTRYAHASQLNVRDGDLVLRG